MIYKLKLCSKCLSFRRVTPLLANKAESALIIPSYLLLMLFLVLQNCLFVHLLVSINLGNYILKSSIYTQPEATKQLQYVMMIDTDVFILLLNFSSTIINAKLFMRSGTRTRTWLIDITAVVQRIRRYVYKALIGLHSFTGCDSTSSFAGEGALQILQTKINEDMR